VSCSRAQLFYYEVRQMLYILTADFAACDLRYLPVLYNPSEYPTKNFPSQQLLRYIIAITEDVGRVLAIRAHRKFLGCGK